MKSKSKITILVMCLGLLWAMAAHATQQNPPQSGFAVTGFIQEATVADVGAAPPSSPVLRGGTLTVDGIKMIVPNNTIAQTPAGTFSWADLFDPAVSASVGYTPARPNHRPGQLGLALADNPLQGTRPGFASGSVGYPSFVVSAVGNITTDPVTGAQKYIVGGMIVPIEQIPLQGAAGVINYIDYAGTVLPGHIPGRFRVGGIPNDPNTGTLCEINDPVGRFGAVHSPDPRFTVDTENPTIGCASGYPAGIPRPGFPLVNGVPNDPDRPATNRPLNDGLFAPVDPFLTAGSYLRNFTCPAAPGGPGTTTPDPYKQMPLMVGDWIDYGGTLMKINPLGPNTAANMFVSIHTITAHLGIRTALGTQPAYIAVEEFIFGVGDRQGGPTVNAGLPLPGVPIAQETSSRVAMIAFTTNTDPTIPATNPVDPRLPNARIIGLDFENNQRPIFPVVDQTQFEMDDPVRGRIRFLTANNGATAGTLANATGLGNFYRMYSVELTGPGGGTLQLPNQQNGLPGLLTGQFSLPIFEYLFGEGTVFGQPIPPFNFNDFGFLTVGDGLYNGGPHIGPLDPFPGP